MVLTRKLTKCINGYTLVEILIVIILLGILSAGILRTLQDLYKTEKERQTFLKNEMEVQMLLSTLKKLFSGIGFGVPLREGDTTSAICTNLPLLGYDKVNQVFCYLSTAVRQERYSGCWWICGKDGTWKTRATNNFGVLCPDINTLTSSSRHNWFLYLYNDKSGYTQVSNPQCKNQADLVYYLGRDRYYNPYFFPDDFSVKLLSANNTITGCAIGTFQINLQIGRDAPQPLINCVADFRVRLVYKGMDTSALFRGGVPIKELSGIRFCMIVQVGTRRSSEEPLPNYTDCGDFTPPNPPLEEEWKHFRWRVIEFNVPLYNLMLSNETA